jgi:hypothetical protein
VNRDGIERGAPWAFAALAVVAFAYIVWRGRGNTFFYDEWSWLVTRRTGLHAILSAYNTQMELAPTVLYQVMYRTVGLAHYWVYRVFMAVADVGLVATLFTYAYRRVGAAAVLFCLPMLFLGSGWEYVLWMVNIGFVTSIALGIGGLLVLDRDGPRAGPATCALLVASLLCTEYAIVFAIGIGVELTWRDRSLRRAYVWLTPLVLYALWWIPYHQPSMISQNVTVAPSFVAELVSAALSGFVGLSQDIVSGDWGPALTVAAVALLLVRYRRSSPSPRAVAVMVAALAYWLLVALGRANLGDPTGPRYVYAGSVFAILIAAEALRGIRISWTALGIGTAVAAGAVAGNIRVMRLGEGELSTGSHTVRAELTAVQLARSFISPAFAIDSHYMPGISAGQYLAAIDQLGSSPADSLTALRSEPEYARTAADQVLVNGGELSVSYAPGSSSPAGPAPAVVFSAAGTVSTVGACVDFNHHGDGGALDLRLPTGGLRIRPAAGPIVQVYVRRFAAGFEAGPIASVSASAGVVVRAREDTSAEPWVVRISSQQPVTACAL